MRVIEWDEAMPIADQLILVCLKIQQIEMNCHPVPDELFDERDNLKDELTEKLVAINAIKFKDITENKTPLPTADSLQSL